MKAIVIHRHGGPDVLELADMQRPIPGPGELLIRVEAIGVNPADSKWRAGMLAAVAPLHFPYVPGYDVAGIVETGYGFAPGTRVVAMLDNLKGGAYAAYAIAMADTVAVVPDDMDFRTAAALPTPGMTGVQMVDEHAQPMTGETVVITGATGAVGRFALFAAKRRGAKVIAAVREKHVRAAIDLGADLAVVLDQPDTVGDVDHLLDTVGGPMIASWCQKVRPGGKILTVATDPIPCKDLTAFPTFVAVHPDRDELARIGEDVAAGRIMLAPLYAMSLDQAAQAHGLLAGGHVGKIVLTVDEAMRG